VLADSESEAQARAAEVFEGGVPEHMKQMFVIGTAEQCIDALKPYAEAGAGAGDFLLGTMAPFHDWDTIERVANEVAPAVRSAAAAGSLVHGDYRNVDEDCGDRA
jgi:alkanesulfonate monooxygenase SsuD/methylene tetrahydromethanopterin reductase-like flavin-dependent oxidoreductase (luciferase family)